mmetsp:Transcript_12296/g.8942  ORF Transcript_12296/g.8942 Transcript_12296/m.8942 type:complete len:150 (+) Transcript_12296:220-669(+)
MAGTLFFGQVYDIIGRKLCLVVSTICASVILLIIPLTAQVTPGLLLARMSLALSSVAALSIPMVTDTVRKTSRGKATAFQAIGFIIGELLAYGVLMPITKSMGYFHAFCWCSSFALAFALFFLIFVKEPNMRKIHTASSNRLRELRSAY